VSAPRFWRFNRKRYMLTGTQCTHCGERFLAPRLVCPQCHNEIEQVAQSVFPNLRVKKPPTASDQPSVSVTVLIPAYNAASTIRDTLSSLLEQDFEEPYEIIVVDSSSDETPRIICEEFPAVHLIHRDQQTDPGTARNLGIVQAKGEIIACIDADCIALPDWLNHMVTAQRAGHEVVGGAIENGNPQSLIAWAGYLGEFREWFPTGQARLVSHVPTCNISYQRSIFTRFGGFPTQFYPQEDLLYHWRLARHGVAIWFDPSVCVQHVHRSTWRAYSQHLRRVGHITARVLELTGEEGAFLVRSPALALLAAPVLPLVKWLRTIGVFASHRPGMLREHALALGPFLVGLYMWSIGFVEGVWAPPLRVSQREVLWQTE
jgi:cellulose synthase/poly-beta-1,6-N-acetylglucosamine synthase-like glycosyltransferase